MATHLLGPDFGASLGTGLLLHGPSLPGLALGRCLLLPEAFVPAGICDDEGRGQSPGPGAMLNSS